MADIVIQPWDKEYWSKGARKRLVDEYRTAGREGRVKEVEAVEGIRRTSDEIADTRRNRQELERLAQQYINRMAEGATNFQYDMTLAEKVREFQQAEGEKERAAAMTRTTAIHDKENRDRMAVFQDAYKQALLKDNPNIPTADLEMQSQIEGEKLMNRYRMGGFNREAAIDAAVAKRPELMLGPGIGAQTRAEDAEAERARKAAFMQQYNLGQQFPSSGVPAAPQGTPARIPWPPAKKSNVDQLLEKFGGSTR